MCIMKDAQTALEALRTVPACSSRPVQYIGVWEFKLLGGSQSFTPEAGHWKTDLLGAQGGECFVF